MSTRFYGSRGGVESDPLLLVKLQKFCKMFWAVLILFTFR
jgi:hypothetical protein